MATTLEIIQDALDRLCIAQRPSTLDVTDDTQRQMLALLNEEGQNICLSFQWQALSVPVVTQAADDNRNLSDQGAVDDLCPGLSRFVDDCLYLNGRMMPLLGPVDAQARTFLRAGGMSVLYGFFIEQGHLWITSPTTAEQELRFAYISKNWARAAQGNGIDRLTQADDVPLLDARLLTLGVVWRWLSRNGMPYQQEFLNYDNALRSLQAVDTPRGVISASGPHTYDPRRSLLGGVARPWA